MNSSTRPDYNHISAGYDKVRRPDKYIVDAILKAINVKPATRILDFGCGTGNYANYIQRLTGAQVFAVEPSEGMREKAAAKSPNITVVKGDHTNIPFKDNYLDFAYMTDVIHHIPDMTIMFTQLARVLKPKADLCIATQSHAQIEGRFYTRFFPATAKLDKERYPDIPKIIECAFSQGFLHLHNTTINQETMVDVTWDFINLVRNKGYSMFHLIPEEQYQAGIKHLESAVSKAPSGILRLKHSGQTLIWLENKKGR